MDLEDTLLMMPGPVPVAPRVLRAMSKPMINHRSEKFAGIYTDCREILSSVFQTKNDIFLLSGSGTADSKSYSISVVILTAWEQVQKLQPGLLTWPEQDKKYKSTGIE
jgi:aspartate aminotransferase-like enzyme